MRYFISLVLLVFLLFCLDIFLGSIYIPFSELFKAIFLSTDDTFSTIIFSIRLPRAITAVLVGIALSLSGLQMQTLFQNPLAGPSILGISSGASLGVASVVFFGLGFSSFFLVSSAIVGASLVMILILGIALQVRDNVVLLILGLMLSYLVSSVVSIWQYFSQAEILQKYILWTFGSLAGVSGIDLWVLAFCVVLGLLGSIFLLKPLNSLLLGENYAKSLGLNIQRTRLVIILITGILAGSVTAFCGPIGFIGIAVPHLGRFLFKTTKHEVLIPSVCLIGACLMLVCDIIAKLPLQATGLPINAVTSLIGAPIVIFVALNQRGLK